MNWKNSKNSDVLLSIFIDNVTEHKIALEETFFSVSKQITAPDLLVLTKGLSEEDKAVLENMLKEPKIIIRTTEKDEKTGEDKTVEKEQVSDGKINYIFVDSQAENYAQVYNQGFNCALEGEYEWFMSIEREDIVALHWVHNLKLYAESDPDIQLYFPLLRNSANGVFNGLMNEAVWVDGYTDEAGKIDLQLLTKYNCMFMLGSAIRPKAILEYIEQVDGLYKPMKENLRIGHYYEFLLRVAYNGIKSYTIPRLGYELRTFAKPFFKETSTKIPQNLSQLSPEQGGMSPKEAAFWMEEAKKQYFYPEEDKEIIYEENGN